MLYIGHRAPGLGVWGFLFGDLWGLLLGDGCLETRDEPMRGDGPTDPLIERPGLVCSEWYMPGW